MNPSILRQVYTYVSAITLFIILTDHAAAQDRDIFYKIQNGSVPDKIAAEFSSIPDFIGIRIGSTIDIDAKIISHLGYTLNKRKMQWNNYFRTGSSGYFVKSEEFIISLDAYKNATGDLPSDVLSINYTTPFLGSSSYSISRTLEWRDVTIAPSLAGIRTSLIEKYGEPTCEYDRGSAEHHIIWGWDSGIRSAPDKCKSVFAAPGYPVAPFDVGLHVSFIINRNTFPDNPKQMKIMLDAVKLKKMDDSSRSILQKNGEQDAIKTIEIKSVTQPKL